MSNQTTRGSLIDDEREKLHDARLKMVRRSRLIALGALLLLLILGMVFLPPWESTVFSAINIFLLGAVLYEAIRVYRLPRENLNQMIETGRQRLFMVIGFVQAFIVARLILHWMQS